MATYSLHQAVQRDVQKELDAYSPLLQTLLSNRGITSKSEAVAFLNPSYEEHLHDPYLLHDMGKAVERILRAIQNNERITIYSDYDCDGIPGAVVLHDFFKAIGFANFSNYIPHRHYEGFGFNTTAALKLHEEGTTHIITIDCGTSDFEATLKAKELGIDVIITDHHEPKEILPSAYAIVNPKIGTSYPFDGLCGSGVIFKLIQALITRGTETNVFEFTQGHEKWLLDMVGLATIADMVPLVGENRVLAQYGLKVLRKSRRPGVQQLLRQQKASMPHLTEDDIGFTIGPRINAASRMDSPEDAFMMLSTNDEGKAGAYVLHLEKLNNERKGVVASMTKEVKKRLHAMVDIPPVLVLGNPDWRPSLVGLVANKLAEEYNRPAFLWGRDGNGLIRGSCRSEGQTSVITLMNATKHVFLEHGGHHFSGGFGVHEDHIHTFSEVLNTVYEAMGEKLKVAEEVFVDAAISLDAISQTFLREHALLAPYGIGNAKPLFLFEKIIPQKVEVFGKSKEHMKLVFDTQGYAKEAIAFFTLPEDFEKTPTVGEPLSLYAHVEQSFFMGRLQTRLRIVDIV
jgi:single-stranded-DNA-specific exonuclease